MSTFQSINNIEQLHGNYPLLNSALLTPVDGRASPAPSEASEESIDAYSMISAAPPTAAIEEAIAELKPEDRPELIQDLYEGQRTCQCCVDWTATCPDDMEDVNASNTPEEDESTGPPLIVRHARTFGGGRKKFVVHTIEVRDAAVRKVLQGVFRGFDGLVPQIKYMTLWAPFKQFYWRWEKFEKAVATEEDEKTRKTLEWLRKLVWNEIGDTMKVSRELLRHGVITEKYIWTLYRPGDIIYQNYEGTHRFYILTSVFLNSYSSCASLSCQYVDWDGVRFGLAECSLDIVNFTGTKKITDLEAFPARFLEDREGIEEEVIARGKKFEELTGVHYLSYRESVDVAEGNGTKGRSFEVSNFYFIIIYFALSIANRLECDPLNRMFIDRPSDYNRR
jgi:hypothetical protein